MIGYAECHVRGFVRQVLEIARSDTLTTKLVNIVKGSCNAVNKPFGIRSQAVCLGNSTGNLLLGLLVSDHYDSDGGHVGQG